MWTDKLKVGDLLVKKVTSSPDERFAIIMEIRETNRPTYGAQTVDVARQEFRIWRQSMQKWNHMWVQDVEVRALWQKP